MKHPPLFTYFLQISLICLSTSLFLIQSVQSVLAQDPSTLEESPTPPSSQELTTPEVLEDPPLVYPDRAIKAGLVGEVILKLKIDSKGYVIAAQIQDVTPAGYGFEEAALKAAQGGLTFKPSKIGELFVEIEITHTYQFTKEMLAEEVKRIKGEEEAEALLYDLSKNEAHAENKGTLYEVSSYGARPDSTDVLGLSIHQEMKHPEINTKTTTSKDSDLDQNTFPEVEGEVGDLEGQILERGTKRPLSGVMVRIEGFEPIRITNQWGRFQFYNVPIGRVVLLIEKDGYKSTEEEFLIDEGLADELFKTYLKPLSFVERVKAGHHIPPRVPTRYDLSKQEIQNIAGVDGDLLSTARDLPGVQRAPFDFGELRFRGGLSGGVYVLGSPLLHLSHLNGVRSRVPVSLLNSVEVHHDYDLRYARAGGGILNLKLTSPPREHLTSEFELNAFDAGVMIGGPISHNVTLTGAVKLGLMRSWLHLLDASESLNYGPQVPEYQDLYLRFTYQEYRHRFDLFISSNNGMWRSSKSEPEAESPTQRGEVSEFQHGTQANGQWLYTNRQNSLSNTLNFTLGLSNQEKNPAVDQWSDHHLIMFSLQDHLKFRISRPLWLSIGVEEFIENSDLSQQGISYQLEGVGRSLIRSPRTIRTDAELSSYHSSAWLGLEGRWTRVHLLAGARVNHFSATKQITPEPRLTLRYTPAFGTILKLGGGLYTQKLDPLVLDSFIGNPSLQHGQHMYGSAGFEQRFTRQIYLDVTGFYRDLHNRLYIDPNPLIRFKSDGTGYATGAETLLRYDLDRRYYGWISYTFTYARLRDGPEALERLSDWSQTHNVSVLFGAYITPTLSLNTRWRYVSGMPYSSLPASSFDSDRGQRTFGTNLVNDLRFEDFHQLDLRLDYRFDFTKWRLLTYIQVNNVYGRRSDEAPHPLSGLNPNSPLTLQTWPTWASVGLRGTF